MQPALDHHKKRLPARGFATLGFPSQRGEILLKERSSPMGETRRKFDKDFREGAVRQIRETGKNDPHNPDGANNPAA